MITYGRPAKLSAFQAISEAQKLAFSPIAFQASVALLRLGVLKAVADAGDDGKRVAELSEDLGVSEYGIRVLLDMGLSIGLVWLREEYYVLDKVGHFLLNDKMTQINVNFVADVCYEAMGRLQDSVQQQAPLGLQRFGEWPTLYPGLTLLPEPARTSWFSFDHFYSNSAFGAALGIVFAKRPRHILDIGGNTGLWALACAAHDDTVRITIVDLPEQTRAAREKLQTSAYQSRIELCAMDVLDPLGELPAGADAIWMSQFLDCFSEAQILRILKLVANVMQSNTSLFVLETLWDRQQHDAAAYSVNATSLYFTCIANGVSRMHRSVDLVRLIQESGLRVDAQHDNLGIGHTLLQCVKRG
jgi:ubiquinone/menaquinone biosynthesis C-methylase UbiE